MANTTEHTVYIGDYTDGYMVSHNKNAKVHELRLAEHRPLNIPEDSVIVFQTLPPWYISDELEMPDDTKILFWNLHPYNLLMYFKQKRKDQPFYYRIGSPYVQYLMKKFLSVLLQHDGIVFMDGENRKSAETILHKRIESPHYVPVAADSPNKVLFHYNSSFAWLGRLADFKVSILAETIARVSEYSTKEKHQIMFYVFGDGPDRKLIEQLANKFENDYFKLIFRGEIGYAEIERCLSSTASLLFAMGASALEGARIGIPTVLLDFSYQALKKTYKYNYIFETKDYTLGKEIDGLGYEEGSRSMHDVINELRNEDRYQEISSRCYQYYREHHDVNVVSQKLIEAIDRCNLRYVDIKSLRYNIIMKTFRVITKSKQM